jgi:hypothetical protein
MHPNRPPLEHKPNLVGPIHPGEPVPVNPVPAPQPDVTPAEAREHPEKVGKPDNIPHDVMALLALGIIMIAVVTMLAYLIAGAGVAIGLALVIGLWTIGRLSRRASRERTEEVTGETHGDRPPPA